MGRVFCSRSRGLLALLGLFAWQSVSVGLVLSQDYQDPDFEVEVFDPDALSLQGSDRTIVVEALAALASNIPQNPMVDMDLKEKALAIALRLDSLNASARATRQYLLNGRKPKQTEHLQDEQSIHRELWNHAEAMKKGRGTGRPASVSIADGVGPGDIS